jgi:hypothetical protein
MQHAHPSVSRFSSAYFRRNFRTLFAKGSFIDPKWHPLRRFDPFLMPPSRPSGAEGSLFTKKKEVATPMKYIRSIFPLLLLLALPMAVNAQSCTTAVCNATGVSESAFLAALPSPSNTNATVVVNIPNGTSAWSTGFSYTVPSAVTNLTIQGSTTVNCTGTAGSSGYLCSAGDNSVIQDEYQSNSPLMLFTVGSSSTHFRITGLTIKGGSIGGSGGSYSKYDGWIQIYDGSSQNFRLDHNDFNNTTMSPYQQVTVFRTFAAIAGVVDHNIFNLVQGQYDFGVSDFGAMADSIGNGDGTFKNATLWGSSELLYVEENYLTGGGVINDCGNAGSMAVRYNNFNNATVAVQTHGTKTPAGPARGCRMIEVYHNYGTSSLATQDALFGTKGATALIWGNTLNAGYYRLYHGGGDRESGDESETSTPNGWGYCGTQVNSNGVGSHWDGNNASTTGYPCLDGLGRGQDAQALNGANFPSRVNSTTGTIAWSHQYLEPQYFWNNSIGSATYMLLGDNSVNNRDYYYDQSAQSGSFTGAAGTGSGPLASRPSSCTPGAGGTYLTSPTGSYGVAYFATDANSGNGELYVCTSQNTWTGIYQPYTYPHPLVSGTSTTPPPAGPGSPTNLTYTMH